MADQSQQHRQIHSCHFTYLTSLCGTALHQALRYIAGSGSKQVSKHQQIALQVLHKLTGCIKSIFRLGISQYIKRQHLLVTVRKNV